MGILSFKYDIKNGPTCQLENETVKCSKRYYEEGIAILISQELFTCTVKHV